MKPRTKYTIVQVLAFALVMVGSYVLSAPSLVTVAALMAVTLVLMVHASRRDRRPQLTDRSAEPKCVHNRVVPVRTLPFRNPLGPDLEPELVAKLCVACSEQLPPGFQPPRSYGAAEHRGQHDACRQCAEAFRRPSPATTGGAQ